MAVPQAKAGQCSSFGVVTLVRGQCYNCNHTTIDDIPKGEPMTAGMFSINNHPAVVLFDSGSSH
jgi:hypothetical protein